MANSIDEVTDEFYAELLAAVEDVGEFYFPENVALLLASFTDDLKDMLLRGEHELAVAAWYSSITDWIDEEAWIALENFAEKVYRNGVSRFGEFFPDWEATLDCNLNKREAIIQEIFNRNDASVAWFKAMELSVDRLVLPRLLVMGARNPEEYSLENLPHIAAVSMDGLNMVWAVLPPR